MHKICYVFTVPITVRSFFVSQLRYLVQNNYDVTVICSMDTELQQELGENIKYLPINIPRGISFKETLTSIRDLYQVFIREKFDLVQYSTPNAALCASIASRIAGIEHRNYHLMGFRYLSESGVMRTILKTLEKITCRLSTSIECVSQSNLELGIQDHIFDGLVATVVWNGSSGGVDLERFDYQKRKVWRKTLRSELGFGDDELVFGFAGRITRDKGINELLSAFFQLDFRCKLLLVGDMEDDGTLDSALLNKAINSQDVLLHPFVPDIERYFAAIDILILPSYREGFGNVIIEAAAVGTPAIVSDIPGPIDAVIPGKTALIVPAQDAEELRNAMSAAMRSDRWVEMGKNAQAFARNHFDSEILNQEILKRKKQLLDG